VLFVLSFAGPVLFTLSANGSVLFMLCFTGCMLCCVLLVLRYSCCLYLVLCWPCMLSVALFVYVVLCWFAVIPVVFWCSYLFMLFPSPVFFIVSLVKALHLSVESPIVFLLFIIFLSKKKNLVCRFMEKLFRSWYCTLWEMNTYHPAQWNFDPLRSYSSLCEKPC
jgi:hypothetical protein